MSYLYSLPENLYCIHCFVFGVCSAGMGSPNGNGISEKNLAKYNRQKCINLLEKITKNLFRMCRDEETPDEKIIKRFLHLKSKLDALDDVHLDMNYHREMRSYIQSFAQQLQRKDFVKIKRAEQMTNLNRLQKLKNVKSYKKEKHTKVYQSDEFK